MKPKHWDKLEMEDKIDVGTGLLNGGRGKFLIAKALVVAIEHLSAEPEPRETSDIQDMEILAETVFGVYAGAVGLERALKKKALDKQKG